MKYIVTYGKSVHGIAEIKAVVRVLKKSTAMGKNVINFEKKISDLTSKNFTLMVNSGSSAFLLLSELLNLKKNDEFIIPAVNFPTAIVPFLKKGMVPVVVDIDINNLQIDINKIKKCISSKTKLIIIPNLIGNLIRWDLLRKIVGPKIILVEDSADTLGAKINNRLTGKFSDFTISSFYGSHVINCAGNGGALSLNNFKLYEKAKLIRSWGRMSSLMNNDKINNRFNFKLLGFDYDKKFIFSEMGYNLEPSELGAAFGLVQLKKLKQNIEQRIKNFKLHNTFFSKYKNFFVVPSIDKTIYTGMLAYPLIIKKKSPFSRKNLQVFLEKSKVQTRPIFSGNFLIHPAFLNIKYKKYDKNFNNADLVTKNGIMIGLHHGLSSKEISYVHDKFSSFLKTFI
jgi:CDP-6-deoxy-D-xylo-4-hexulose-3-dehydrase